MNPSSRSRLTVRSIPRFPGASLFHRVARTVAAAECLPRKELFEAWEVARRVRRRMRGGRVVDLACGHGLLASLLLVLDDTSPEAIAVDAKLPKSAPKLQAAMAEAWPRLAGRVRLVEAKIEDVEILPGDVVCSVHACGERTDVVLDRAAAAGARVAVLPCCHDLGRQDTGGLEGWIDGALAIDVLRATRLRSRGYRVSTQTVPARITPKNRLLVGAPPVRQTG